MRGPDKPKWFKAVYHEIGRLLQVIEDIKGKCNKFLSIRTKSPNIVNTTYCGIVCDIRKNNKGSHRVKLKVVGDNLTYNVPVSTPTLDLNTSKIFVIELYWPLAPNTWYLKSKHFYLNSSIPKHEYYNIALILIPRYIIDKYDIMEKHIDGFIYVQV